jgi:hypothetical protein
MNKIILFFVAAVFTLAAFKLPDDICLRGQVTDIVSKDPIAFANVKVRGTSKSKLTDGNGYYSIKINNEDVLEFSASGYSGKNRRVSFEDSPVDVELQPYTVKPKAAIDTIKAQP